MPTEPASKFSWNSRLLLAGLGVWFSALVFTSAQQPAFPGAEGFGAFALGGRSGTVYHVTNLNDSGPGSLRTGCGSNNCTIVFDVSGTINLGSKISITQPNITVAGQTAPGDGIATKGWMTEVKARNVIVRYIRCRPGDVNCPSSMDDDAFHFEAGASNCIADHVSASWSLDEALSTTHSTNITVQWCMIAEPLNHSCHDEGSGIQNHGYGSLIRYDGGGITYHHNLYAHCLGRNPRGPSDRIRLDFVNNVVYNWGILAGYNEDDSSNGGTPAVYTNFANYVGNYLIAGTNTTQSPPRVFRSGVSPASETQIYQTNNFLDANKNGVLDGVDNGWSAFGASSGKGFTTNFTRFAFPQVTTDDPNAAYVRVLSAAGPSLVRDVVDSGVVSNVINQNGVIINSQTQTTGGGWPTLNSLSAPLDTDQDGMPDFWEVALGSTTNNAADRNDPMPDGYTRLEWYLNWLAGPHARATNSFADVELRQYTAGLPSPTYSVNSPSNGTVALLGDGHTARFTPTPSFSGLASFAFTASGSPASLTGAVSVLVSPVAAPPLTPFEQWQIDHFGSTNNPAADPSFDADGDGQNNQAEFLSGTNPTNSLSALRIISVSQQSTNVVITWATAGGFTNAVQAAAGDANGSYATNFTNISGWFIIPGSGDTITNHTDSGGATNSPARYYRVQLVP